MHSFKKVFLIDDDTISNFLSSKLIQNENFAQEIQSFIRAEDALDSIQKSLATSPSQVPQVIFLDINMPEMDGWGFLSAYQRLPKKFVNQCRLFMLSSAVDKKDIVLAKSHQEVEEFISKPLTPEILGFIQDTRPENLT